MKFSSLFVVGLLSVPAVLSSGLECYDCKALVKQLHAKGEAAVTNCYNPKFPRKQQPECTSTSTCYSTVTRKYTSTKVIWKPKQTTKTVYHTGQCIKKTINLEKTAVITKTATATVSHTAVTTEHTPTITKVKTITSDVFKFTKTVNTTTTVVTAPPDDKRIKRAAPFDCKASSAACYCLHDLQPKRTKTVKVHKTKTKSICAKTTTVTKKYAVKPATKTVKAPCTSLARKTRTKTLTNTLKKTTDITKSTIIYTPTTKTETTSTTVTITTETSSIATVTCRPNIDTSQCELAGNGEGAFELFRRDCGLKILEDPESEAPDLHIFYPASASMCSVADQCYDYLSQQTDLYLSFFITKARLTGQWMCTVQAGASEELTDDDFVYDNIGLEVFFYSVSI